MIAGTGVRGRLVQRRKRKVPSIFSAAESGNSQPCCLSLNLASCPSALRSAIVGKRWLLGELRSSVYGCRCLSLLRSAPISRMVWKGGAGRSFPALFRYGVKMPIAGAHREAKSVRNPSVERQPRIDSAHCQPFFGSALDTAMLSAILSASADVLGGDMPGFLRRVLAGGGHSCCGSKRSHGFSVLPPCQMHRALIADRVEECGWGWLRGVAQIDAVPP